jgi:hypothetical protein
MSLLSLIKNVLDKGDKLADAWVALQEGAKLVPYPEYEAACIACIAEVYEGVTLNKDGTLPKSNTAAYGRLKRLRRAHPDFVAGTSNKAQPALRVRKVQAVADGAIAAIVAAGLSKAELMAVLAAIKSGVAFK